MVKFSFPHPAKTVFESDLRTRMAFLRKYFATIAGEFLLLAAACTFIMLTPVARFYVAENEWLLYLLCFLYASTYVSILCCAKLPVVDRILIIHVIVQAFAISICVTYNDWLQFYKAILISSFTMVALFIYTLQSKWDFNIWIVILISSVFIDLFFIILKGMLGGTMFEDVTTIVISIVILLYQLYAIFKIMYSLTPVPSDYIYALINVHTLPVNAVVFSTCIFKPTN